jgi:cytochrome P450
VHCCLGAALVRMDVNSFLSELLPRLETGDYLRRGTEAPADPLLAAVH